MASLLEIADHADVPVEGVLRVLNGETVSGQVAERVTKAMEALGSPHDRIVESLNVLGPPPSAGRSLAPRPVDDTIERAREQLLETFARAAAELEATLPQGVSSVVFEALRVEVEPVAQRMDQMGTLLEQFARYLDHLQREVGSERAERLEDIKLLVDLIVTGWRSVDRRLGRVELVLQRQEDRQLPPEQSLSHGQRRPPSR